MDMAWLPVPLQISAHCCISQGSCPSWFYHKWDKDAWVNIFFLLTCVLTSSPNRFLFSKCPRYKVFVSVSSFLFNSVKDIGESQIRMSTRFFLSTLQYLNKKTSKKLIIIKTLTKWSVSYPACIPLPLFLPWHTLLRTKASGFFWQGSDTKEEGGKFE